MSIIERVLNWIDPLEIETKAPEKTIKDIEFFDDVWIKDNDVIYKGWVWEKTRRHITVIYNEGILDFKFNLTKPFNRTSIEQDNKVLYCNKIKENEDY